MKPLKLLLCCLLTIFMLQSLWANPKVSATPHQATELSTLVNQTYNAHSIDAFLDLTPRKIKKATGQKLTLKETIALKTAQKKVRKAIGADKPKNQLAALILAIFVGLFGFHRFYLGYVGIGLIQLLTAGCCGIWTLVDIIRIVTGDLRPADGSDYDFNL